MSGVWDILKSGHWPSLAGALLHLTISFMVWLLIGAMSIPLMVALQLSETEIASLVSLPLLGGAVLRMVAGWSADWLGAWPTAVGILVMECLVLCWGWLGVTWYGEALAFSTCLGVAGASFAVALPIASRAYPLRAQGFVLGIAASGNIGTVFRPWSRIWRGVSQYPSWLRSVQCTGVSPLGSVGPTKITNRVCLLDLSMASSWQGCNSYISMNPLNHRGRVFPIL